MPDNPEDDTSREELPEVPNPENATVVSAASLVAMDSDRPIADNKITMVATPIAESAPPEIPSSLQPGKKDGRGRKPLSEDEKNRRAVLRAQAKAEGKPPPDFSDIKSGAVSGATGAASAIAKPVTPRNYYLEATAIFVATSTLAGKMMGPHWSIDIDHEKKEVKFTEEQKAYIMQLAGWIEYEKFSPASPRIMMAVATIAYCAPKLKTEPTPEKLKHAWISVSSFFKRLFGKKEKRL